jgi:hypothetical protein
MESRPSKSQCFRPPYLFSHAHGRSPLTQLGSSFTEPVHEIDADISRYREERSTLPRYHPLRPICAGLLAFQLKQRYELLNQKEDIDKSILYLTESLLSSPRSWLAHGMIAESLFFLAVSLLVRLRVSKEPEDAISAAKCLRLLRDPAHPPFTLSRQLVTAYLVETLAFQMELKASDVIQTLEEMAALTHELLTSDPSCDNTNRAIADFVSAALTNKLPDPFPDEPLNQIIACLRLARVHKPELREVHFYLAICLTVRYFNTQVDDDYEEAMSIMDETIISNLPGDIFVAGCQTIAPWLAMTRFENPENLEEVMYRVRTFLASCSVENPAYPTLSYILEHVSKRRFQYFGPIDGLEASSSDFQPPLPSELADDSDLSRKRQLLNGLISGIRNNDITDIDVAIKSGRTILASSDPSDL